MKDIKFKMVLEFIKVYQHLVKSTFGGKVSLTSPPTHAVH